MEILLLRHFYDNCRICLTVDMVFVIRRVFEHFESNLCNIKLVRGSVSLYNIILVSIFYKIYKTQVLLYYTVLGFLLFYMVKTLGYYVSAFPRSL